MTGRPPVGCVRRLIGDNGFGLLLCGIVLFGAGLRAYRLDYQSLWTDEIFSLTVADPILPFRDFWKRILADTHPPIYYLILRWSSGIIGQSEIAVRAPSAFFGGLTLCAAAVLSGSALSSGSRLAFLLLLAISPGAVWYAREARSYALLLLLSTVITLACIRFVQSGPGEARPARITIVTLTATSVLASFTHYFGFIVAAASFFTCFVLTDSTRRLNVALAGTSVIACVIPWVAYHWRMIDPGRATWIGELSLTASLRWFEYLSFGGTASVVLLIGTAMGLFAAMGWRGVRAFNPIVRACALLCLLTLVAGSAISFHTPILTSRNMIVVLPALYLITAELTTSVTRHWGRLAGAVYLAFQTGLTAQPVAAYYTTEINEQWRDSAALVLGTPGCEASAIRVYGDSLNYRFFTARVSPNLHLIEISEGAGADLSVLPRTSCPILLWIVGVPAWDLDHLLVKLGLPRSSVNVVEYHEAFVVFRKQP